MPQQYLFRTPTSGDGDPPEWQAPSYAKEVSDDSSEWKPPEYAKEIKSKEEDKPNILKKIWNKVSEPLTEAPTRFAESVSHYINPESTTKGVRGIGSAYIEGLGHAVSGLTSPLNLAFGVLGAGESAAIKYGLPEAASALRTSSRVLSAPIVAEGAKNIYKGIKDVDLPETLSGGLEAGLGISGMRGETPKEAPKDELPIRRSREIPYRIEEETSPKKDISIKQPREESFVNPFELNIKKQVSEYQSAKDATIRGTAEDIPDNPKAKQLEAERQAIWKAPSYANLIEEPQAARTSSGKLAIGADIKSLGKVLGTSLYKGDIAPIATKELLQNSIDAVRHLDENGRINVKFDRDNGSISVIDNGKGLTRQELESVFTDLGASGKREDSSAAGGFGLAKAAPLLGGEKVEVSSIARDPKTGKLTRYSFNGTPHELLEGVDIKEEVVSEEESTGTSVKVYVPKNSNFYDSRRFVENLSKYSPNIKSQINLDSGYGNIKQTRGEGTSIATLNSPSATTELIEPKESTRSSRTYMGVNLSNNGMYQGTKTKYFNSEIPNVPSQITVDIRPKVPEGHSDYPFTANREELRGSVDEQVNKYIDENIIKPGIGKRLDELKRLYNSMKEVNVGGGEFPNTFGHKIAIYDPKGQISSAEMRDITSNPSFHTLAGNIAGTLKEAMKVAGTEAWRDRLEKIGIIFEDSVYGIHIPNPGNGKSAILVNPFISIRDMSPDEASSSILHTILHELAHVEPSSPGHNESFTIRLADIYSKFGARRSVEAQDQILKSIADPNTGVYHDEIQKILSTYKASRGREATTEDLLSGTGVKSRFKGGREDSIPPDDKSNGEGVTNALDKLFNAMGSIKEKNVQQETINKAERAKRFAAFSDVKGEGVDWARKALSTMKGQFDKVEPGERLQLKPEETNSLFTAVKQARITEGEKLRGITALFKIMNGESIPARNELRILDDVFGNGFADRITELHGGIGAVGLKLSKLANTMKSMQNSISLAAPLRHGIGLVARKEFYPAFGDMFKFFANKSYYDAGMKAIEERPNYLLGRESGLFLSKPNSLQNAEEEFLNSYVGSIPGVRDVVGASQRAYTGFLNKLRADTFDSMVKQAKSLGFESSTKVGDQFVPTKEAEAISKFINNATGRGSLGSLNKMTNELNLLLWSPRMISSRINMLANPKIYMDLPKGMRLEGIKSLLGIAALGTAIDTLAAYGGAKVSTNILSTDAAKARFGTKLIDPWGGFQQYIVAAARFLAGKTDSAQPTSRLEIGGRFLANKESPAASLAHQLLTAKKFTGKSDDPATAGNFTDQYGNKTNIQSEIGKRFLPIFVEDLMDLSKSEPGFADNIGLNSAMGAASLTGMAQNYPEKKKLGFRNMKLQNP